MNSEMIESVRTHFAAMSRDEIRASIKDIYDTMVKGIENGDMQAVEWETTHHFGKGSYCREFFVPAGTLVVGKLHHTEHFVFALDGTITVLSENGVETITAPRIILSTAGIQRVGYAHTDTRWAAVFHTDETDTEKLEDMLFSLDYQEYLHKEHMIDQIGESHDYLEKIAA